MVTAFGHHRPARTQKQFMFPTLAVGVRLQGLENRRRANGGLGRLKREPSRRQPFAKNR